jgi:hypothetical protein
MAVVATAAAGTAAAGAATVNTAAIITAIGTALAGIGSVVVPAGVGFASSIMDRKDARQQKMDEANAKAKKFQPLIILGVAALAVIIVLISIFKK